MRREANAPYTPRTLPELLPELRRNISIRSFNKHTSLPTTPKRRPPRRELEDVALEVAREDRARAEERGGRHR